MSVEEGRNGCWFLLVLLALIFFLLFVCSNWEALG